MANNELKKEYDTWHSLVHGQENRTEYKLMEWHRNAFNMFSDIQGKNILEVGCGPGDFSLFLYEKGAKVTGLDFSESAIQIAKEKAIAQNKNINFLVGDAQKLPFESSAFDVLYSCECLEHIPDPQLALNEFFRVLKPGGRLILTTENYSNGMLIVWFMCWLRNKPFNSGDQVQPIENFFLYWKVKRMMKKAGFTFTKMDGWHFVFFILPGIHPHTFVKEHINNSFLKGMFKPFARHVTFFLQKRNS